MRGSIFIRVIATLFLIGVLVAAGVWIYNAGQAQGYALGAANSGQQLTTPSSPAAPAYPYPYGYPGFFYYRPHFFFPFGLLIGGFFFFLFVSFLFRVAFFPRRHMMGWGHGHPGGWHEAREQWMKEHMPPTPGQSESNPPAGPQS